MDDLSFLVKFGSDVKETEKGVVLLEHKAEFVRHSIYLEFVDSIRDAVVEIVCLILSSDGWMLILSSDVENAWMLDIIQFSWNYSCTFMSGFFLGFKPYMYTIFYAYIARSSSCHNLLAGCWGYHSGFGKIGTYLLAAGDIIQEIMNLKRLTSTSREIDMKRRRCTSSSREIDINLSS
ncbi:hypothetical protein POM88_010507 [Heracleum sosnowskyi]|uniref:Uncharacterized protein n=1 Tax=Heracleum sosnowskyi TaxID=360622 RepID=A0AAD8IV90_9APIA|nr:hypothetical protein POM88_010507 [Heracleum sosnowskyi]